MKIGLIISLFILSFSIYAVEKKTYLVTTHDPHILKDLYPHVNIIMSEGRTLLVNIKDTKKFPQVLKNSLRQVQKEEVLNFVPKSKKQKSANPKVAKLIEDITAAEMREIVDKVASFNNRRSGSDDNLNASKWIKGEFEKMGLATELDCFKKKTCNVYGKLTGSEKAEEIILVEAHLDSVGHDGAGADDNASGIAGLLMIAKRVASFNPKTSFIFFATNGEEQGLLGAEHYAKVLKRTGTMKKIKFVINMDMIGYNNSNQKVDLETNKPFLDTARWMSEVVETYTTLVPNIVTPAWGSDHVPFLDAGIPTILTIEHWPTKTPCYHSACDVPEHLNYDYGIEIVKLNVAAAYLKSE